jgi:AraC-like DNA-binding protein
MVMAVMHIRQFENIRTTDPGGMVGGGIHPYYELLLITSGEVVVEWMEQKYRTDQETLFLINPDTPHKLVQISKELTYTYLEFELNDEERLFPNVELLMKWNALQIHSKQRNPSVEWVYRMFRLFLETVEDYSKHRTVIMEHIMLLELKKMLLCVHECFERLGIRTDLRETQHGLIGLESKESMIHRVMHYMECHYMEELHLHTLSRFAHLNSSYLIRLFKEITGLTPFQYLHELRMSSATSLLRTTALPIQEVAEASGFKSIHYFSRSFHKKYNATPTAWRRRYQKNG